MVCYRCSQTSTQSIPGHHSFVWLAFGFNVTWFYWCLDKLKSVVDIQQGREGTPYHFTHLQS
jgi:hypothetical protein